MVLLLANSGDVGMQYIHLSCMYLGDEHVLDTRLEVACVD